MKNIVFFVVIVAMSLGCGLLSDAKAAGESNGLDGTWSMTERFCVMASTGETCGTNEFDMTVTDGVIYVEGEEVGSVTQTGKKVSFEYNTDYLSAKFEELFQEAGYDVTVESFTMKKYEGKVKNNRMSGKIKGTVDAYFALFQKTTTLSYTGKFKGVKQ